MSWNFSDLAYEDPIAYVETLYGLSQHKTSAEILQAIEAKRLYEGQTALRISTDAGGTYIETVNLVSGGSPASVASATDTALELAQSSELTGSAKDLLSVGQGAMETGAGTGVYKTTTLLSLDVGVVGAAVAPVLGVALGAELYNNNPRFWTMLSEKLLPFCYPGTTEIPGWLDIVESAITPGVYEPHVVIDRGVLTTMQEFLREQGIIDVPPAIETGGSSLSNVNGLAPLVSNQYFLRFNSPVGGGGTVVMRYWSEIVSGEGRIITICRTDTWNFVTIAASATNSFVAKNCWIREDSPSNIHTNTLNTGSSSARSKTYNGKTVRYSFVSSAWNANIIEQTGVNFKSGTDWTSYFNMDDIAWSMIYEFSENGEFVDGTSPWEGDTGNLTAYDKPIVYMKEDPDNPGSFILESVGGIEIAVNKKKEDLTSQVELTKPEHWPEGVDWPVTIEFPWPKPDWYQGEWPETMPFPLPNNRPDWWPDILPYPEKALNFYPSLDAEDNPNPNQNSDLTYPLKYIEITEPGKSVDPVPQPAPDPVQDPGGSPSPDPNPDQSLGPQPEPQPQPLPQPVDPITTPVDTVTPPPSNGESPTPLIPEVELPFTSANDGLISVYHPTDAQLKAFASWLWVTYADPSIEKLWNNPFDGVIGLMEIYCTPTDDGTKSIRSGFLDSGVVSATVSRYTEINCGTVTIPEYYGNYLDYSPYSKCHVYLPFIGIVELNVDDIVGHAVNITYRIDEYNGSCIAQITVAKSTKVNDVDVDYSNTMYQFSGNCAVELPLAGGTQSAIRAGLIQAAAYGLSSVVGGIASGVSGNIGGAISQLGYGAANAIGSVVSAKSSVQHSGSFGSSYGAMGIKVPYIVVTRPRQIEVLNYNQLYGYQAHAMVTIGSCSGYLRVREVEVKSTTASDEEKKRIEELLKEGVYIA